MVRPAPLMFNDRAVILSPAGSIEEYVVHDAADILEGWGLDVEISPFALGRAGRFSGTVEQRLHDLQSAFDDAEVKLVLCSRGGYGVMHLLERLDFSVIRKYPKWVVGFSDVTALHAALQRNGIVSVHAPMAKHFSDEGEDDVSVRFTKSVLAGQAVSYEIPTTNYRSLNRKGRAFGQLFGGNLSLLSAILGSKFAAIPRNGILFIEDVGEVPYKVDRMIYGLRLAGVFKRISGLIVGRFADYEEDDEMYSSLYESVRAAVEDYDFPVCFNFPVGHVKLNFPLLMGERAELTVGDNQINFKQIDI